MADCIAMARLTGFTAGSRFHRKWFGKKLFSCFANQAEADKRYVRVTKRGDGAREQCPEVVDA